ncbi:MAG: DUF4315 family protein [Clostridiales bacterium]|nr:DUF4315 family protein [Clostridiales bacterium]
MSAKLNKIGADLEKARAKWREWEAKTKELEARYREQENTEICDITHAYNLTPDQLAELLRMMKETMPETAPAQEVTNSFIHEEEEAHED